LSSRTLTSAVVAIALLAVPAGAKAADRNHDGLSDTWEKRHHLSLKVNQSSRDQDHDGLNNRGERAEHTNPRKADSDRDGLKDGDEVRSGNSPRDRDSDDDGVRDGDENAGTVDSFDSSSGVLKIKLMDGTIVSGKVTDATRLRCREADENEIEDETTSHQRRGGRAKAASNGEPGGGSDASGRDESKAHDESDDAPDTGEDRGDDEAGANDRRRGRAQGNCAATELKAGAPVREAELDMTSAGAIFDKVELLK
jgi:hypothetical protein